MRLAKGNDPRAVRCSIGARMPSMAGGSGHVVLTVGEMTLELTPEQADEMSADLRTFAIEVRNGGQVR